MPPLRENGFRNRRFGPLSQPSILIAISFASFISFHFDEERFNMADIRLHFKIFACTDEVLLNDALRVKVNEYQCARRGSNSQSLGSQPNALSIKLRTHICQTDVFYFITWG